MGAEQGERMPMHVVKGLLSPLPQLARPVVTLGAFDGVHRGHQRILAATVEWAGELGGEAVAITFDPLPKTVVGAGGAQCITSLPHRLLLLERCGVDAVVVLAFDRRLGQMAAEAFVEDVLVGWIGTRHVVVGRDARFGSGGEGDLGVLRRFEAEGVLEVRSPGQVRDGGRVVSSTAIRQAIAEGELGTAEAMLGRPYSFLGSVVRGRGRGRSLGFPTANLDLHHEVIPPHGVYAATAAIEGQPVPALTYIGTRPTFEAPDAQPAVEVHVIGLDDTDLYGREVEVVFVRRLRGDRRFASPEALVAQMEADRDAALAICGGDVPGEPADPSGS